MRGRDPREDGRAGLSVRRRPPHAAAELYSKVMAVRFNQRELALNRSGRMSARQRRAFFVDDVRKLIAFVALLVCFAGCVNAARNPENHAGDYAFYGGGALIWLISLIGVLVAAGRSLRDGLQGRVVSVAGGAATLRRVDKPLFKVSRHSSRAGRGRGGRPLVTYEFKIGGRSWNVDEGEYHALSKLQGPHKVYYAAHTCRILSYEPDPQLGECGEGSSSQPST